MVSFDIFDTLITRKTIVPNGIFLIVQNKLKYCECLKEYKFLCDNFSKLRIKAEQLARQNNTYEITFDEIYEILQQLTAIPDNIKDLIMEMEVKVEFDNSYPLKKNIECLKELYNAGEKVVLISDMYLEEKIIRNILTQWDSLFENIPIYVSTDWKNTKGSGLLFFNVAKTEHCSFQNWTHYGDNKISDYLVPKMLGIEAKWIKQKELESWEKELADDLDLHNNLPLQSFLGVSRIIRLENELSEAGKIGASIGEMLLYPYVSWLISKSIEYNINCLYFIARDGYILKIIADEIIKNKKLNIKTKYIYGSRIAWRTDSMSDNDRMLVLRYLEQEIDFFNDKYAFVDLHGTGYTMNCVADIISKKYDTIVKVFYFDRIIKPMNNKCMFIPFISFGTEHFAIVEHFCRAPHGVTIGYRSEEENIIPIIERRNEEVWKTNELLDYSNGLQLAAQKMAVLFADDTFENLNFSEKVIDYCQHTSCETIIGFLKRIPHSSVKDDSSIVNGPKLSLKNIFMIYMYRTIEPISDFFDSSDLSNALIDADDKIVRLKEFFEKNYDSFLGKMVQCYKNRANLIPKMSRKKIIIYGAGKIGQKFHRHLLFNNTYEIVAWTDMNYEMYEKQKVISLKKALEKNFDYIVIAIANKKSYRHISCVLENLGVDRKKIQCYQEYLR